MANISLLDYLLEKLGHSPTGEGGFYQDRLTRIPGINLQPSEHTLGKMYPNTFSKTAIAGAYKPLLQFPEARQAAQSLPQNRGFIVAQPSDKKTYNHELIHGVLEDSISTLKPTDAQALQKMIINQMTPRIGRILDDSYPGIDEWQTAQETAAYGAEHGNNWMMNTISDYMTSKGQHKIAENLQKVYKRMPRK